MASNIKEYKARKWKTKAKKDIANKDDVMDLYNTLNTKTTFLEKTTTPAGRKMVLKFTHVRAHQGIDAGTQAVGNE